MQGCQNCFLRVQIKVLRNFFENVPLLFNIFGKWAENYPNVGWNFPAGFSKLHLKSPEKQLEDFFEKSATFPSILDFILKIYTLFCRKSSASLSEMNHRCQVERFEKKQSFWKKYMFFLIFFELPANFLKKFDKNNSARVPNWIICVCRGKVRAKSFFWKKNHFLWCS